MNGVAINEDERMTNKRKLEADLALIRSQKAEVLRSIQQISKKQKLGGPPTEVQHRSHEAKVQHAKLEHERRKELIFATCIKIIQELLKNHNVKQIFLNPVSREIYPQYYITIKRPICLSDIKGTSNLTVSTHRSSAPCLLCSLPYQINKQFTTQLLF